MEVWEERRSRGRGRYEVNDVEMAGAGDGGASTGHGLKLWYVIGRGLY